MIRGGNAVKREKKARKMGWVELQNKPGVIYFTFSKKAMNLDLTPSMCANETLRKFVRVNVHC
ncbi:protein of unknown function [Methylotuvimicrobium alcaliphilum 20Z]|uniref:Uncharacterized protein n=1 Tax=Methylotuvimicrobium alcaliphilum (strain DSM 19304 / NCIMB 14124 / VKM B-2133 / 20Z) TaxID=1091494 RepID=G4SWS3_META2|nr:protein of unknown function [Methylotuvimicrobium alcaliphilum 20Z]